MKNKVKMRRIATFSKEQSIEIFRIARKRAMEAVENGLQDSEAYHEAQRVIESHRDRTLDKFVVTT